MISKSDKLTGIGVLLDCEFLIVFIPYTHLNSFLASGDTWLDLA